MTADMGEKKGTEIEKKKIYGHSRGDKDIDEQRGSGKQ